MADAWADHGFASGKGNPVGLETSLAARGLWRALVERENAYCEDEEDIVPLDGVHPVMLSRSIMEAEDAEAKSIAPARAFAKALDSRIKSCCRHYLNHRAYEKDKTDVKKWTFDDLCEAVSEINDGEAVIDPYEDRLIPNSSKLFARQRYQMINLLKTVLLSDGADCEIYSGDVHTGVPSSPDAADDVAKSRATMSESKYTRVTEYREDIYGPTHGWREGSYCCNIWYVTKIKVQKGFGLMLDVEAYREFDDFGTGLKIGMNKPETDDDGCVVWPLSGKSPTYSHAVPVEGVNVTYGWSASIMATKEAWKDFTFYHDVEEEG